MDEKSEPNTKRVERALRREGLLAPDYVDGHYGKATIAAYARWQRRLGVESPSGTPGEFSLKALGKKHGFRVVA